MIEKDREAKQGHPGSLSRSRPDTDREAEARALAQIYKRAIERCRQKETTAEVGEAKGSTEVRHSEDPPEKPSADEGSA